MNSTEQMLRCSIKDMNEKMKSRQQIQRRSISEMNVNDGTEHKYQLISVVNTSKHELYLS